MSKGMAQNLRIQSAMDHEGTVKVGRYKMLQSGNAVGGIVPREHARVLGLLEKEETDVYINYELGVVMHQIPNGDDGQ